MKSLKSVFVFISILLIINLIFIGTSFAEDNYIFTKAGISKHSPETVYSPEETIPVENIKPEKKGSSPWSWVVLGIVAIAVGAAAGGGGGGGDNGGRDDDINPADSSGDGNITVGW